MSQHDPARPPDGTRPAPGRQGGAGGAVGARCRLAVINQARRLSSHLPPGLDRNVRQLGKAVIDYRGARASYLRWMAFGPLGRASSLLLAPFGEARLLVDAGDDEVGRVVYASGGYERLYMQAAVTELARRGQLRTEGTVFVDVGANIGTSTVDALVHYGFSRALCFEPDVDNHRLLRMNLVLNGLDGRTTTHRLALSDTDGEGLLELAQDNPADHRVAVSGAPASEAPRRTEAVTCRRLDTILAEAGVGPRDIALMWVDTQGHEAFVLGGAPSVVAAGVPAVVEYWPSVMQATGALEPFEEIVAGHYDTVIDVHLLSHGLAGEAVTDAHDVVALRDRYRDGAHTDLLLLRSSGSGSS